MFDIDDREDRKTLPITARQLAFAHKLAMRNGAVLPWEAQKTRSALSAWIEQQSKAPAVADRMPPARAVFL